MAATARRRLPALPVAPWIVFLVGGLMLTAAVMVVPGWDGEILWDVVPVLSVAAMVVGIRRRRPAAAAAWWWLVAGTAWWAATDLGWMPERPQVAAFRLGLQVLQLVRRNEAVLAVEHRLGRHHLVVDEVLHLLTKVGKLRAQVHRHVPTLPLTRQSSLGHLVPGRREPDRLSRRALQGGELGVANDDRLVLACAQLVDTHQRDARDDEHAADELRHRQ